MHKDYLIYNNARVHYHRYGIGEKVLISLHGFGDRAQLFSVLEPALHNHYTVYALDLPYHGETQWPEKEFSRADLIALLELVREKSGRKQFDIMAYSFGGRLVMSILPELLPFLEKLYLIAPDGIRTKWMFNVDLMPHSFRLTWFWLLQNPNWFLRLLKTTHRLGIISKFIYDFTRIHISTPERRQRLLGCWLSMSHFNPKPKEVKKLLQQAELPTHLYFGTRDEVIPLSAGQWLSKETENIHLHVIEEGHLLVDEKLSQLLQFQLQHQSSPRSKERKFTNRKR